MQTITTEKIIDLATVQATSLPDHALATAKLSFLDWLVCSRAGIEEPLAKGLRQFAVAEGASDKTEGPASIVGGGCAPVRLAAMINGAISHALDYDDTHFAHVGHLSVGIYPAVVATGEDIDASVTDMIAAFLVGAEAAIRTGCVLGTAHYNRGFHQTATAGAFGATVATARLRGLDAQQLRYALGFCASRASGLKSQFGTMGKPLNAGFSASNGVEATALAACGLTSAEDGLMGEQGFVQTHTNEESIQAEALAWTDPPPEHFRFVDNSYKFHACCHGTHAMIEGLSSLLQTQSCKPQEIASIEVHTNPRWLKVCDIDNPQTGLEVKFSYRWLAAMVFHGLATADDSVYTSELAHDDRLAELASKVSVTGDDSLTDQQVQGVVCLTDGKEFPYSYDLEGQMDRGILESRLFEKAHTVLGLKSDTLLSLYERFDSLPARELGEYLRSPV